MRMGLKAATVLAACLPVLAGCGDTWLGEEEGPPLPGKRISILLHESSLHPEADAAKVEIKLPEPEANADWAQTAGMSHHAMEHLELAASPERAWRRSIGSGSNSMNQLVASPVVADGRVYAVDTKAHIAAYDPKDGSRIWRVDLTTGEDTDSAVRGGGIAFDAGRLFVGTGLGQLWALDAQSGNFYWKVNLDAPLRAAPTVYGGRIFVVTASNKVSAYAESDGKKLWEYVGAEEPSGLLGAASPAADMGVVVVALRNGALVALRADSGSQLWEDSLAGGRRASGLSTLGDIKAPPVIADGRVYAIGNGGLMVSIDLRTGGRVWEKEIGGVDLPWIAGDYLFVVSNANEVIAMQARTGNILWVTQLSMWKDPENRSGRIVWTGPVLAGDRLLLAGSHGYLLSISPYSGKVLGYEKLSDGVSVPPVVAGGTVYVLTDDADLIAYR